VKRLDIGSMSGFVSDPGMAVYNASKAFVHGPARSVAVDHGPNVRWNAVSPGWIATGMVDDAFAGQSFVVDGGLTTASPIQPGLFQ